MDKTPDTSVENRVDPFKKEDKKEAKKSSKPFLGKKVNLWVVVAIIIVVGFLIWSTGAAITGAAVIDAETTTATIVSSVEERLDQLGVNLNVSSEIEACSNRNSDLQDAVRESANNLMDCQILTGELKADISTLERQKEDSVSKTMLDESHDQISDKEKEIADLKDEIDTMEDKYLPVIKEAARKICCFEKVDDSSINSYNIGENKIHCVNDGENSLSC